MKPFGFAAATCLALGSLQVGDVAAARLPPVSVRGGLSFASVQESWNFDASSKLGFAGGLSVAFRTASFLSIQPEILYSMKGFSYGKGEGTDTGGNPIGQFETLHALDYIEIPVLARATLQTDGRLRPSLLLGPSVAFEVSERFVTTGSSTTSTDVDHFLNTDFGITTGVGLAVSIGSGQWLLDARYVFGLNDLNRSGTTDVRSRAFQLTTGWSFGPRP